jgi:hypothetical protein
LRGLLALALGLLAVAGCGSASTGPLQAVPCCTTTSGSVRAGQPFQFLVFPIVNTSDANALTLRKVELLDPTPGVRLLGAYALKRGGTGVIEPAFPAARAKRLDRVDGYVVPPTSGAKRSIDVALRLVADPGPEHVGAVGVDYESGGSYYSATLPESMAVCASGPVQGTNTHIPSTANLRRCDPVPDSSGRASK